jgi:hypothetical protein
MCLGSLEVELMIFPMTGSRAVRSLDQSTVADGVDASSTVSRRR